MPPEALMFLTAASMEAGIFGRLIAAVFTGVMLPIKIGDDEAEATGEPPNEAAPAANVAIQCPAHCKSMPKNRHRLTTKGTSSGHVLPFSEIDQN
jgi:hypothetical protein